MFHKHSKNFGSLIAFMDSCRVPCNSTHVVGFHFKRSITRHAHVEHNNPLKQNKFVRMLEYPTSPRALAAFSQEIAQGHFSSRNIHAMVHPDIRNPFSFPFDMWTRVGNCYKKPGKEKEIISDLQDKPTIDCWQVRTVAAQMKTRSHLRKQLLNTSEEILKKGDGGSILLVSGGHPLKGSWPINCFSSNSFELFQIAYQLRSSGLIPSGVELWAVENPLVNSVDRLEKKITAGAEAFILQPPLLPDCFTRWWDEAIQRGLMDAARIIVGLPFITSSRSFSFWLHLTQANGTEAEMMLTSLQAAENCRFAGESEESFFSSWNLRMLQLIKSLPKVSGVHFMPISAHGWQGLAKLFSQGNF